MNILHNEPALHIFGAIFIIQLLVESIERFPLGCKDIWSRSEFAFSVPDYWIKKKKAYL